MPRNAEQEPPQPGRERMFFDDRVGERDTALTEVLGKYKHTAGQLAKDYVVIMDWLGHNSLGFNEADFTDATTAIATDAQKIIGSAGTTLEEIITDGAELRFELTGDDAEIYDTLLDHAKKPGIGTMHASVRAGLGYFSTPNAQMTANAALDTLRLEELKESQRAGKNVTGRIDEFSTAASRQAASAVLDQLRFDGFLAQARDKDRGIDTLQREDIATMSMPEVEVLTTVALDGERFKRVQRAQAESQKLGLGDALAAMRIEDMSCQPVKDIAYNLINKHFKQREAHPDDKRFTTWLGSEWNEGDPFGQQQRRRQRARRTSSSGGSRQQSSAGGQYRQGSGSSQGQGYGKQRTGGSHSQSSGQTRGYQERPAGASSDQSQRRYEADPNREPSTATELQQAKKIRDDVARYNRQYSWFKTQDPEVIIDVMRAVRKIRGTKGNEGIRDRKVFMQIRQTAEQNNDNQTHPSHTWVQLLDAMLRGNYGKEAKLPF